MKNSPTIRCSFFAMLVVLFLVSCKSKESKQISFYFWRTKFQLSEDERQALRVNHVNKLYIRYFDLDNTESGVHPVEPVVFLEKPAVNIVIPVVYIKNRTFMLGQQDIGVLADKTLKFIQDINKANGIQCNEIQLDCDWTPKTQSGYFNFIHALKKASNLIISATIRLHQIKFSQKTGVPEVDYGVLMYYNMGNLSADSLNSIYDKDIAGRYLQNISFYPKKLKVALPIFHWYVHFRNHKVTQLYTHFEDSDFESPNSFSKRGNSVVALQPGYVRGVYLEKNDVLKLESIAPYDLDNMIADLKGRNLDFTELILFDLNSNNLKKIKNETIRKISTAF